MIELGDEMLVPGTSGDNSAELEVALLGDMGVFDADVSEGGVNREIPDDSLLLAKSP